MDNSQKYDQNLIQVLEGLEAVRKRPGMYIGATNSKGLHHLVTEIIDNAIDEALAGFCTQIKVVINKDESISVSDDGRGIPVDIHQKTKKPTVETVFTVLHAGGKFDGGAYKISGGLHGVGSSVVNALSEWLNITVYKDSSEYNIKFHNGGKLKQSLTKIGDTNKTGTIVSFLPDKTIFTETIFNLEKIRNKIQQTAFLNKGLILSLLDLRLDQPKEEFFLFKDGVKDYVKKIKRDYNSKELNDVSEIIVVENIKDEIEVECGFQYIDNSDENIMSFCNNINTPEGGTHIEGSKLAFVREINSYFKRMNPKSNEKFIWDDIKEGLVLILSVKHKNPEYEGQTKTKLGNEDAKIALNYIIGKKIKEYLLKNPKEAKKIINKIAISNKARKAAQNARENTRRKSIIDESFNLPGKLADCSSKTTADTEIFIVEGNSAGGSAKAGRDREIQAILPLKGKVLNVEKSTVSKIYQNNEILSIFTALGTNVKDKFDISKLRYGKVVIMTDADVDGSHIRILLLTLFYRFMKPLIENGNIYIAQPPLYKIDINKKSRYCFSDLELEEIKKTTKEKDKVMIQRYKGLGEMNAEQLWETTMDPEKRTLLKVTIEDAIESNLICSQLMGVDVEYRKEFIRENAKYAKNIDF